MPVEQRSSRLKAELRLTEIIGEFISASNLTLLATEASTQRWVYKASEAMSPLWDFDAATLPQREVATYLVSQALGFDLVPETVMADGPLGFGSAQRFIDADPTFDPRTLFLPEISDQLWPVAVLDILCNNADRKLGHLLAEKETGRLYAIDNGLTFHPDPKLRTVLWSLAGRPLPEAMRAALDRARGAMGSELGAALRTLLTPAEVQAFSARINALIVAGTHPQPPADRPPIPWPVW
jgi:hypothetical protein